MRVLITGGAGFIGSHLVDALVGNSHEVAVIDDLSTGRAENLGAGVRFHGTDIRDSELEAIVEQGRFDVVFHFAAVVDARESVRKPTLYHHVNVQGSLNLLKSCRKYDVPRIVYASSVAVYGEPDYVPVDEGHPTHPVNPYGWNKQEVEGHLVDAREEGGLEFTVLRFANVYGPRQNDVGEAGVVATFARNMLRKEPVAVYGKGDQVRDFVYVADAVAACLTALEGGTGGVYNIGTGRGTTVNELFNLMKDLSGYRGGPTYEQAREGEIHRMVVDPRRAARQLGWEPTVLLEEGLRHTLDFAAQDCWQPLGGGSPGTSKQGRG